MKAQNPDTPMTGSSAPAVLSQLVRSIAGYAGLRLWLTASLMIVAALLEGFGLLLLLPILGLIISGPLDNFVGDILLWVGLVTPTQQLIGLIAGFIAVTLVRAQAIHMRDLATSRITMGYSHAERVEVIARLAAAGWSAIAAISHARITSLIANDIPRASVSAHYLLQICVVLLMLGVNGVIAFTLAPDLIGLLLLLMALGALFLWLTQRNVFAMGDKVHGSARAMMESTQNTLAGLKTALAQESQARFVAEFERVQSQVFLSQMDFVRDQSNARRIFAIASAMLASALVLGGLYFDVEPARLIVLVVVLSRLSGPLLRLQQALQNLLFALPSYRAVMQLREQLPVTDNASASPSAHVDGALLLEDVVFRHADGGGTGPLSFSIAPGEFIGIAGPSGAGKSTLIDILAGLLLPQSGQLCLGGRPLDAASYPAWRGQLSYLGQQVYLFNDSLRENLIWDAPDASEEDIWQALELVGAGDLVRSLSKGLDAPLGEGGVLFSGGERQRIALARSLLRKPSFIILDEATSALDIASEKRVLDRLAQLANRPSIVMVAHRPESLHRCDRVLHMDGGLLVPGAPLPKTER